MKRQLFIITLTSIVSLQGVAKAADTAACSTIRYEPNRIYTIRARLNHATHIVLPESASSKPVVGNSELWNIEGNGNHLFVKPTNANAADGASTTVTVVGASNTSYDFEVARVASGGDLCVRLTRDGVLVPTDADWRTPDERKATALAAQLSSTQEALAAARADSEKRALNTVREYQSRIYTQYKWTKGKGFMGENFVSDVWDDGRFTYVRATEDNKGVMQVTALVDGKKELINYDYDTHNRIYTLSGLFPALTLTYGKSSISVERADNKTAGL